MIVNLLTRSAFCCAALLSVALFSGCPSEEAEPAAENGCQSDGLQLRPLQLGRQHLRDLPDRQRLWGRSCVQRQHQHLR